MNLWNFSSFVVCCLRVFVRSVSVLIAGCFLQGIGVGQAWLSIQVFMRRTSSSIESQRLVSQTSATIEILLTGIDSFWIA